MALYFQPRLTSEQVELLGDILDLWIEERDDVVTATEQDRSLDTVEQMLDALDGLHHDYMLVKGIKEELERVKHDSAAGSV